MGVVENRSVQNFQNIQPIKKNLERIKEIEN